MKEQLIDGIQAMSQTILATFEDGVLRPEQRLDLPPHARVRLTVTLVAEETQAIDDSWKELEELWKEASVDSGSERLTRDQLHERR
jgi:predicted DNA-binding antitoxin AbrB/MazE fold protein